MAGQSPRDGVSRRRIGPIPGADSRRAERLGAGVGRPNQTRSVRRAQQGGRMSHWVYVQSEPTLWTVGFYSPDGKWHTDSDHGTPDDKLKVEPGNEAFLVGHAVGTQNYVCKPSGTGVKFVLFTPEATLFKDNDDRQIITHFFSPNPAEPNTDTTVVADGIIRATWQARDSSSVWAKVHQPDGTLIVDQNSIAWVLLDAAGTQDGPTGGHTLSDTTFVQRVNTTGGLPPSIGCTSLTDLGNQAFVPYTADYFFYKKQHGNN